ncbi:MAG: hypothetical protein ACOCYR_06925 [Erythrobacter sp.]
MPTDRTDPGTMRELTPDEQAQRDAWPAERQSAYDAWPEDTKNYYWSLTPERQEIFWRLRDEDKIAITRMGADRQEASWKVIEQRMANPPSDG